MNFQSYLQSSVEVAETEAAILDQLRRKEDLSPIEIRAAKSSMQTLIENCIGKAKRILKHYNCPIVPKSGRDAILFLYETGAIGDEEYRDLSAAVGFRNAMIHDNMNFSEEVLIDLLKSGKYRTLYNFLVWKPELSKVVLHRIATYTL